MLFQFSKSTFQRAMFALIAFALTGVAAFAQQTTTTPRATPPPTQQQSEQGRRYGQSGFVGEPINLNVVNAQINDILSYITEQYGVNFIIDRSVKQTSITVNLSDVPWNVALDAILRANGLGIDVQGGILRVADAKVIADEAAIQQQIRESQLDTAPLYTEIIQLNYARATGTLATAAGGSGNFVGGSSSQSTLGIGGGGQIGSSSGTTGGDSTGGGGDNGIMPIIQRRLSRRGAIEVDGRGNRLIITDVRQNIDAIRQLVSLLDRPEPQVEIETRIVVAQRNFLRDIGTRLGISVNNPFGRGGVFGASTSTLGSTVPSGTFNLTTGVFGTATLSAALNLAETKGQAKTIASPRVTALNNRPAEIESGSQIPVVTVQDGGGRGGVVTFTTTFVSVPLRLSVTPQISEAGTILMKIVAENNNVNPALASGLGGTPGIDTQRMKTEVLVPDGGTTVVGGVLVDAENESRNRVPGLASIPLIGNVFKSRTTQRTTNEIIFFITPRIYRPDFEGNPTPGKVGDSTRSTTIIQPVPLGNPPSNSNVPTLQPQQPQTPVGAPFVIQPQTAQPGGNQPATQNPNRP